MATPRNRAESSVRFTNPVFGEDGSLQASDDTPASADDTSGKNISGDVFGREAENGRNSVAEQIGQQFNEMMDDSFNIGVFFQELLARLFPLFWIWKWHKDHNVWAVKMKYAISSFTYVGTFIILNLVVLDGTKGALKEIVITQFFYAFAFYVLYSLIVSQEAASATKLESLVSGAAVALRQRKLGHMLGFLNERIILELEEFVEEGKNMNGMTRRSHIGMEKLRQVYLTPADETIPDDDDAHNCKVIVQQILAESTRKKIWGRSLRDFSHNIVCRWVSFLRSMVPIVLHLLSGDLNIKDMNIYSLMVMVVGEIFAYRLFYNLLKRFTGLLRKFYYRLQALMLVSTMIVKPEFRSEEIETDLPWCYMWTKDNLTLWLQIRTIIEDFDRSSINSSIRSVLVLFITSGASSLFLVMHFLGGTAKLGISKDSSAVKALIPLILFDNMVFVSFILVVVFYGAKINGVRFEHIVMLQKELLSAYAETSVLKTTSFYSIDALRENEAEPSIDAEEESPEDGEGKATTTPKSSALRAETKEVNWDLWQCVINLMRDDFELQTEFETIQVNHSFRIGGLVLSKALLYQVGGLFLTGLFTGITSLKGG